MKISELRDGMRRVNVVAKVLDISEPREVYSRFSGTAHRVATATISDESGTIKLTLWNDQIDKVKVNDTVSIENGYIKSFRGEIQLNVGRYGKLSVL
ncbi:DNA-binding protein [Candidatus Bathyarchaeota archaeon]|nr:MAG: DNA-binding protein [Candidatus Bathyarchaeota archaeon]